MSSDEHKIKVKIERLDTPNSFSYTNTGLRKYLPAKEEFTSWSENPIESLDLDFKSVYLEYDEDWDMFAPPLMQMVSWYTRSYFSSAKKLNISIDIEGVDK